MTLRAVLVMVLEVMMAAVRMVVAAAETKMEIILKDVRGMIADMTADAQGMMATHMREDVKEVVVREDMVVTVVEVLMVKIVE